MIQLSIASIAELFKIAANTAFEIRENECPDSWASAVDQAFWRKVMLRSGSCPSQMSVVLATSFSVQTLHFMTLLGQIGDREQHNQCTQEQCLAGQVDLEAYKTKHVDDSCSCSELSLDETALQRILMNGDIPLVSIEGDTLLDVTLKLESNSLEKNYFALLHIWADGLGNKRANALPRCQPLRLEKMISATRLPSLGGERVFYSDKLYLWRNTLCCARRPAAARKLVIASTEKHSRSWY